MRSRFGKTFGFFCHDRLLSNPLCERPCAPGATAATLTSLKSEQRTSRAHLFYPRSRCRKAGLRTNVICAPGATRADAHAEIAPPTNVPATWGYPEETQNDRRIENERPCAPGATGVAAPTLQCTERALDAHLGPYALLGSWIDGVYRTSLRTWGHPMQPRTGPRAKTNVPAHLGPPGG